MSLIGALNIGKSAMSVTQAAIQTTGNNIANAGNADYTRQVSKVTPNKDQQLMPGIFVGTGVNLSAIQRQIDESLEGRIRSSVRRRGRQRHAAVDGPGGRRLQRAVGPGPFHA